MTDIEKSAIRAWAKQVKLHAEEQSAKHKGQCAEYLSGEWAGQAINAQRLIDILDGKTL